MEKAALDKFWKYFSWGFMIVNTVCLVIGVEILATGKASASLFILIFLFILHINFTIFKKE